MELEAIDRNEIKDEKEILDITQFELNDQKNKKTQELFHYVLGSFISKYNQLGDSESKSQGIYYMKERHILLVNLTEEMVQSYIQYKDLFDGLMSGKTRFFREFEPNRDNRSIRAYSYNPGYKVRSHFSNGSYGNNKRKGNYSTANNIKIKSDENAKIKYNLNQFSYYFNGMFFESRASGTLFKLIDQNYGNEDNDSECLSFLPRLIFYQKEDKEKQNNPDGKEYHGYNEIDCAFILKGKSVEFNEEMITCFNDFKYEDESHFFATENFCKLKINQDNVVLLEIKSSWKYLSKKDEYDGVTKDGEKDNELTKFIKKAKRFVHYYIELNLIEKSQNIILIYLYNNSMYYDPKLENKEILKAYDLIKNDENFKLYIAYFQPYLKLMNSYDRVKKLKTLNQKVKMQQEEINRQKMEIIRQNENQKNLKLEIGNLKEQQSNLQKKFDDLEKRKNQEFLSFKKEIEKMLGNKKIPFSYSLNQVESSANEKKDEIPNEHENDSNGEKNSISSIGGTTVDTLKNKDVQ